MHLVNLAKGTREEFRAGTRQYVNIREIPPVKSCTIQVRVPHAPRHVTLQPQGQELDDYQFHDGWVKVKVPSFAVHQMVAVDW